MRISDWSSDVCSSDLAPDGSDKAPIDTPRRAMGDLLGHAVRFGVTGEVMAAGEGIETMLSLRMALPTMPMAAALSAAHRSEERRVGKECVSTCRSRWSPSH